MKILVADDSKTNLALITSSLLRLGHCVVPVKNGEEAVHEFRKELPDLIILDVVMDGLDGYECAAKIRTVNSDIWIPIIFLSASVDDDSIAKGINAGGDDYLAKPFSDITLGAKIKAMQRIAEMRKKLFDTTQELKILSSTDMLTGVYNRLQFEKSIKEKLAAADRHQLMIAVMFIDLDHFKTINDTLGHHIGDLLIKAAAHRLKRCLRVDDFIARIGGDEFVIILSEINVIQAAESVANKILRNLSETFLLDNHTVRISASIGIACYPHEGTTHETLIQSADIAMYYAKSSGRNNFQYYSSGLNKTYRKHITLEHELKFALERNQISLVYQPIWNLVTHQIEGVEALLRWKHNEFGQVSPKVFIPIAEETGLIMEIGTWALQQICSQGAKWFSMGHKGFKLSFNISLHQLLHEDFTSDLSQILSNSNIPSGILEFELTETSLIAHTKQLRSKIHDLIKPGISIAIDDFGTRYSALSSLQTLPISTLKIDKAFIKDIQNDYKNNVIARSLIALGNNLNLNVIAKGITNNEQIQFLVMNGCSLGQGVFLSKPVTGEKMILLLKQCRSQAAAVAT